MIYNTDTTDRRGLQRSRARTAMAIAALGLGAFVLGGLLLVPTLRASSSNATQVGDPQAPRMRASVPATSPDLNQPLTRHHEDTGQVANGSEPEVMITETQRATEGMVGPAGNRQDAGPESTSWNPRGEERKVGDLAKTSRRPPGGNSGNAESPAAARKTAASSEKKPRVEQRVNEPDERYYAGRRAFDENAGQSERRSDRLDDPQGREKKLSRGSWRGRHTGNPATLEIARVDGDRFEGTLSVRVGKKTVRTAVSGEVSDSGDMRWDETLVLKGRSSDWDLGSNSGQLNRARMEGSGRDARGRTYSWWFSR